MDQLRQAIALTRSGDEMQALSLTDEIISSYPEFAPAYKLRGELLEGAGRRQEAAASYERALALSPDDPDIMADAAMKRSLRPSLSKS